MYRPDSHTLLTRLIESLQAVTTTMHTSVTPRIWISVSRAMDKHLSLAGPDICCNTSDGGCTCAVYTGSLGGPCAALRLPQQSASLKASWPLVVGRSTPHPMAEGVASRNLKQPTDRRRRIVSMVNLTASSSDRD